jgi:ribonuclease HII
MTSASQQIILAGVDEAGRGPLAGPVSAAAVILGNNYDWSALNDSKKLSEKKRDELAIVIKEHALSWFIASASEDEIDKLNIHHATLLAMKRAVEGLGVSPNFIQIDGKFCPDTGINSEAIIKGDSKVKEISAASILAKTWRDDFMKLMHKKMPEFEFNRHKGYPTKLHIEKIEQYGVSYLHRKTFKPVAQRMSKIYKGSIDE